VRASPFHAVLVVLQEDELERAVRDEPRLTTVMGVARAVLATVGPRDTARVLIDEFGWDATFHALALLKGDAAVAAFGATWSTLLLDGIETTVDAALKAASFDDGWRDRVR
jgi:hypothetical protein